MKIKSIEEITYQMIEIESKQSARLFRRYGQFNWFEEIYDSEAEIYDYDTIKQLEQLYQNNKLNNK